MTTTRLVLIGVAIALATMGGAPVANGVEQAPLTVQLWPDKAPGKSTDLDETDSPDRQNNVQRITNVGRPSLALFKAKSVNGPAPAVVVCPGGAYSILAYNLEGTEVARWLNSIGVTAVVLKYRVPDNRAGALQDVQRAMRLVRHHASAWNIDPKRVGVLGFSAGGHLAARASTAFAASSYTAVDQADQLDCRPDFTILVYAAYLSHDDYRIADDVAVTRKTPPAFVVAAQDDVRNVDSSLAYYLAMKKAGVPTELHLFPSGGHGFGLRPPKRVASIWPKLCETWLKEIGMLRGSDGSPEK